MNCAMPFTSLRAAASSIGDAGARCLRGDARGERVVVTRHTARLAPERHPGLLKDRQRADHGVSWRRGRAMRWRATAPRLAWPPRPAPRPRPPGRFGSACCRVALAKAIAVSPLPPFARTSAPDESSRCTSAGGTVSEAAVRISSERPCRSTALTSAPASNSIASSSPSSLGGRMASAARSSATLVERRDQQLDAAPAISRRGLDHGDDGPFLRIGARCHEELHRRDIRRVRGLGRAR